MTAEEIVAKFAFMKNGLKTILFKTSPYVPVMREGGRLFIFLPTPPDDYDILGERLKSLAGPKVVIMHPDNYPAFADMMAGKAVLQEYVTNFEVRPRRST